MRITQMPRLLVAGHEGALDRCRAAPARQERGMQVEAAERGRIEDRLRQDEPVGHDDRGLGRMACETLRPPLRREELAGVRTGMAKRSAARATGDGRSAMPRPAGRGMRV